MARAHTRGEPTKSVAACAVYLRVSTDEQAQSGLGLAAQLERARGMAAAKGWPAPAVYRDEGLSGTLAPERRPALARLLAAVRAGELDAIIVADLSRLGRHTVTVLNLLEELRVRGITFVSCKEALDSSTPQGQFVATMFAALGQLERDMIAQRTRDALGQLAQTTGDAGGRIPYGYVRVGEPGSGVVRVNMAAAAIVRRIFNASRRGDSLRDIARKLNSAEISAPLGGHWRHTTVASILSNRALYAGGKRAESAQRWPAILGKRETEEAA